MSGRGVLQNLKHGQVDAYEMVVNIILAPPHFNFGGNCNGGDAVKFANITKKKKKNYYLFLKKNFNFRVVYILQLALNFTLVKNHFWTLNL